ncbi:MAG TPA: glycoside hydrolase family 76 protein [Bacilli bacterium]
MKLAKKLTGLFLSLLLAVMLLLPARGGTNQASAFTTANADTAMNALINVFWDPTKKYFYANSDQLADPNRPYGPENGKYSDFWWEAQMWETVMDAYERTNSSTYLQMIHDVYDGFIAYYPTFANDFNDDLAWWAQASIRAYELTGSTRYKDTAISLFDRVWAYWDSTYGGGIWWKNNGTSPQKNIATNGTMAITAVRLKIATSDSAYLTKAQQLYDWMTSRLVVSGHVYDHVEGTGNGTVVKWDFSYNFGNYIGSALALYLQTSNSTYLSSAVAAADWVVNNMSLSSTAMYEGLNDSGGFKMVLMRNLNKLVNQASQTQYLSFLQDNATQAFNHRRNADNIIGPDWTENAPSGVIQSLTAAAGASILQFVTPDNYTGLIPGNGIYQAENAIRYNITDESTNAGYTGRGYLAGWNANGQYVNFKVNVKNAGAYRIAFTYSAAAGNASRYIFINTQGAINNLVFPSTGSWTTWNKVEATVNLNAGTNTLSVIYDSSKGSTNYLNLDKMTVYKQYEAESATLKNLTTESTHAGYTGTGYVAGWNANGQWVDFNVDVAKSGTYTLVFRYAAGAGNASRYVYVNGVGKVNNQGFTGTGSWSTYSTVSVTGVALNAGSNTVSLIYDSTKGSTNWLNLDHLVLQQP